MDAEPLSVIEVHPRRKGRSWYAFQSSSQFVKPWWRDDVEPAAVEHWLSVQRAGDEVARCKFILFPEKRSNPLLGEMPHGQLDILAFEVALSLRGRGIGRDTLLAIKATYPTPRLTALNDDEKSRGFWDSVGWIRHESPHPFLRTVQRRTYSES